MAGMLFGAVAGIGILISERQIYQAGSPYRSDWLIYIPFEIVLFGIWAAIAGFLFGTLFGILTSLFGVRPKITTLQTIWSIAWLLTASILTVLLIAPAVIKDVYNNAPLQVLGGAFVIFLIIVSGMFVSRRLLARMLVEKGTVFAQASMN